MLARTQGSLVHLAEIARVRFDFLQMYLMEEIASSLRLFQGDAGPDQFLVCREPWGDTQESTVVQIPHRFQQRLSDMKIHPTERSAGVDHAFADCHVRLAFLATCHISELEIEEGDCLIDFSLADKCSDDSVVLHTVRSCCCFSFLSKVLHPEET